AGREGRWGRVEGGGFLWQKKATPPPPPAAGKSPPPSPPLAAIETFARWSPFKNRIEAISRQLQPELTADDRLLIAYPKSRRRSRQNLLVLRRIFVVARARRDNRQVIAHLIPHEDLADLGDEQVGAEV